MRNGTILEEGMPEVLIKKYLPVFVVCLLYKLSQFLCFASCPNFSVFVFSLIYTFLSFFVFGSCTDFSVFVDGMYLDIKKIHWKRCF